VGICQPTTFYGCLCRGELDKGCVSSIFIITKEKMVPVFDHNLTPLMPCKEKRARQRMEKGQAKAYWQKGVFCIRLVKVVANPKFQEIIVGLDPGSQREGYTVATSKSVVLNITTDTKGDEVKKKIEARRRSRRSRRQRKTPYRKCRFNRASLGKKGRLPVSTYVRWNTKLLMVKYLLSILPITSINVEDIKAPTKEGKGQYNKSFSPLEVGKTWFYSKLEKLGLTLTKTEGYQTKEHRDKRAFEKSKDKLSYVWEAHNVDSHSLAEIGLKAKIEPYRGLWKVEFLNFHRRALHRETFQEGGIRPLYGSTVSMGMRRGSVLWKNNKKE
jgi:RRXRR protein